MGTRAVLATPLNKDLLIDSIEKLYEVIDDEYFNTISLSFDGYPDNVYHNMMELIKNTDISIIMAGGNIQSLGAKYEPNPLGYHSVNYPQHDVTVVYKRDVDDKTIDISKFEMKTLKLRKRIEENDWPYFDDYLYVISDKNIFCSCDYGAQEFKLAQDMIEED